MANLVFSLAAVSLIAVCVGLVSATQQFEIITSSVMMNLHPTNYLSVTIDADGVDLSVWPDLVDQVFGNSFAREMATHLSQAAFRFGGTTSDQTTYDMTTTGKKSIFEVTMNATQWDAIVEFAKSSNFWLIFTINVLPRNSDGSWNSTNFEELLVYTIAHGVPVYCWELGNEPDLFQQTYGITISPQQLAADYQQLRSILDAHGANVTNINGPALAANMGYYQEFATAVKDVKNVVTHSTYHHYYGDGADFTVADFYSVTVLDSLISYLSGGRSAAEPLTSTGSALWLGETSSTYGGGTPGASTAFVAGFMWLDKLGLAPYFGISVVCRQDFWGGNYGLFGDNVPYPDYWSSVLFKQLVGPKALEIQGATDTGRTTRVYAFCSNGDSSSVGSTVIVALNIATTTAQFEFQSTFTMFPRQEYHLTAPGGDISSSQIQLNGVTLVATPTGGLPSLDPVEVTTNIPITLAPLSYAFIVFPESNSEACK